MTLTLKSSRIKKKEPLKILVFSFDWRNLYENNISEIFEKLERDGLDPYNNRIFSINWSTKSYYKKVNNKLETAHLKAYFGKVRIIYDVFNIFLIPFLLMRYHFRPDLIIVRDFQSVFIGLAAKLFKGSRIVVIVTNVPTQLARTRRFWKIRFLYLTLSEYLAKKFVDYAIAISETTETYLKDVGVPRHKIRVFSPNVIYRDKKFIESSKRGIIRKRYNVSEDKKIILSVGRLEPEKNFEALVGAFYELNDASLVLLIVGQGGLMNKLKDLVNSLGLNNRVIFAGNVERSDIWNYYKDADLFILLSKSEGLGLVFWEAMYIGVPVIGPKIEGIAESIGTDGKRGFFWNECDDIDILRKRVYDCCLRTPEVRGMSLRASTYVLEKISSPVTINELL